MNPANISPPWQAVKTAFIKRPPPREREVFEEACRNFSALLKQEMDFCRGDSRKDRTQPSRRCRSIVSAVLFQINPDILREAYASKERSVWFFFFHASDQPFDHHIVPPRDAISTANRISPVSISAPLREGIFHKSRGSDRYHIDAGNWRPCWNRHAEGYRIYIRRLSR